MLLLTLTAELNGVTDFMPKDTADSPYLYTFTVQCTSCRETHPNPVSISRFDKNEMSGSKGEANFVWRCKNCKREHSATILTPPNPYTHSAPPKRQQIISIDCRGLEFLEFIPDGEFQASALESTTKFPSIDLGDGDWYDYDEKAGEEVSVKECSWEVRRSV